MLVPKRQYAGVFRPEGGMVVNGFPDACRVLPMLPLGGRTQTMGPDLRPVWGARQNLGKGKIQI